MHRRLRELTLSNNHRELVVKMHGATALLHKLPMEDVDMRGTLAQLGREHVPRAVELLLDLDWLAQVGEPTAGRPRTRYLINPRVERRDSGGTAKTDKSPPA